MNGLLRIDTNSRYSITPFTESLPSVGFCIGFVCLSIPTLLRLFGTHCGVLSTTWTIWFKNMLPVKENIDLLTNMPRGCYSHEAAVLTLLQVLPMSFGTKRALACPLQSTTCVKIFLGPGCWANILLQELLIWQREFPALSSLSSIVLSHVTQACTVTTCRRHEPRSPLECLLLSVKKQHQPSADIQKSLIFSEYPIVIRSFSEVSLSKYGRTLMQFKRFVITVFNARHVIFSCWLDPLIAFEFANTVSFYICYCISSLSFLPCMSRITTLGIQFLSSFTCHYQRDGKAFALGPDVLILGTCSHTKTTS